MLEPLNVQNHRRGNADPHNFTGAKGIVVVPALDGGAMKALWGSTDINLCILYFRIRWRMVSFTPRPPNTQATVSLGQEAGWAPEPIWLRRKRERIFALTGNRTWSNP
jgi:hypothetical protein